MINSKFQKKGFSLIELLISITIIGILTSIILSSLSRSRNRAYDSKIQQQLSSFRTSAQMYLNNKGSYEPATSDCSQGIFGDFTPDNGQPGKFIDPANIPSSDIKCQSTDTAYAVKILLNASSNYWCVDNTGASKMISDGSIATSCN